MGKKEHHRYDFRFGKGFYYFGAGKKYILDAWAFAFDPDEGDSTKQNGEEWFEALSASDDT